MQGAACDRVLLCHCCAVARVQRAQLRGGETYTFSVKVTGPLAHGGDKRSTSARQHVFISGGNAPTVGITARSFANFDERIVMRSDVLVKGAKVDCALSWDMWRSDDAERTALVSGLFDRGALDSKDAKAENLVVRAGGLAAGRSYTFRLVPPESSLWVCGGKTQFVCSRAVCPSVHRLEATRKGQMGWAEHTIYVNSPPLGGSLLVSPSEGMSVRTAFALRTVSWSDPDRPLTYRFGCLVSASSVFLGDRAVSNQLTARMPVMNGTAGDHVFVLATDAYGAAGRAAATVVVRPYVKPANVTLAAESASLLSAASARGDTDALSQLVSGLAIAMNAGPAQTPSAGAVSGATSAEAEKARPALLRSWG